MGSDSNKASKGKKKKSVNPGLSFTHEDHSAFVTYLRKYSERPYSELVEGWNLWASKNNKPQTTFGMVRVWIAKLSLPHSQAASDGSAWVKKKKKEGSQKRFDKALNKLQEADALRRETRRARLKSLLKKESDVALHSCECCKENIPVTEEFFSKMPPFSGPGGKQIDALQLGLCKLCNYFIDQQLRLLRIYKRSTEILSAEKRKLRRFGVDLAICAAQAVLEIEFEKRLAKNKKLPRRICLRCNRTRPLDSSGFYPNRGLASGEETFRPICRFCDDYFTREKDRRKRDGESVDCINQEITGYLVSARDAIRLEARKSAKQIQQKLQEKRKRKLKTKACQICRTPWIEELPHASRFWRVAQYKSRSSSKVSVYLPKICKFCHADNQASKTQCRAANKNA